MDAPPTAAPAAKPGFDRRAWREPCPSPALIRVVGWLNRAVVLPHLVRLRRFDLPDADLARLRAAVRPGTAAFLGPNHPEFFTDWMVDKELSFRVSPLMAHWASYEIVNVSPAAQWLWLRNNLVANVPGGGGREYSIRWALAGHGVLLHPEGTASWHGERVGPLMPGIVDMAWETCARARAAGRDRPVFVVPIVWRLRFTGDVSRRLAREMALIERALGAAVGRGARARAALRRAAGGAAAQPLRGARPAGAAGRRAAPATSRRRRRPRRPSCASWRRRAPGWSATPPASCTAPGGATRPEARRQGELYRELWRLAGFPRDLYDTPTLSLEAIAENLKRQRSGLLTAGWRNALHNVVPVPAGPRVAHVRVPEPIAVHEAYVAGGDERRGPARSCSPSWRAGCRARSTRSARSWRRCFERSQRPNPLWTGRVATVQDARPGGPS